MSSSEVLNLVLSQNGVLTQEQYMDIYDHSPALSCVFLNEGGRCSIHAFRPGICRLFPLGRIYDEHGLAYFLQSDGCVKTNRTKVKVSKWLDTPDLKKNQQYLIDWHDFRKKMEEVIADTTDEQMVKTITMFLLNTFFIQPYDVKEEFYTQFYRRLERIQSVLG